MLLTKIVKIKINSKLIKFYKKKGYKFNYSDITTVLVKDLSIGSHAMVDMCCDSCGTAKKIRFSSLKDKKTYNWLCHSCGRKKGLSTGKIISNFNNKELQKELANRNKEERKEKTKKTKLKRYGNEYYSNREKRKETMLERYDEENFSNSKKRHKTMKRKYGKLYNNPEKHRETCVKKYGVISTTQIPEIFHKIQISSFKIKKFKNYNIYYRGSYEYAFLELCEKLNIINLVTNCKTIKYKYKSKNRVYYPDFYFPTLNLIVEIKSKYTYKSDFYKNLKKKKSCIEQGYEFLFIIDKKYENFITLIQ